MTTAVALKTAMTTSGDKCLRDLGLHPEWTASDGLPPSATVPRIEHAIALTAAETRPCPPDLFAVQILRLVKFGKAFGCLEQSNTADMTGFYREGLNDVPADLLQDAVDAAVRSWKWGNRMPFPADLRILIAENLNTRTAAKYALERALWRAKFEAKNRPPPQKPLTAEQQAQVERIIQRRKAPKDEPEETPEEFEARKKRMIAENFPG